MTFEHIEEVEQFDRSSTPFALGNLMMAEHHDDLILLDRVNWRCHVLPPVARAVWETIDGELSIDQIIDLLVEETDLDRDHLDQLVMSEMARLAMAHVVTFSEQLHANPEPIVSDPMLAIPLPERWDAAVGRAIRRRRGAKVIGCFRFGDAVVQVGTDVPAVAELLRAILRSLDVTEQILQEPPLVLWLLDSSRTAEGTLSSYFNGRRVEHALPVGIVLQLALQELNQIATQLTFESILLHAGAVERDGEAVVLVGESGMGKSTLTAAMVRSGYAYLSDEIAIIDPESFAVRAYPKAIDLAAESCALLEIEPTVRTMLEKSPIPPDQLGSISAGGQLAVIVLLVPETSSGTTEDVPPMEALRALLTNVFVATYAVEDRLQRLVDLCATVRVVRMPRATPVAMVDELTALLRRD